MTMTKRLLIGASVALLATFSGTMAGAQSYPSRNITVIIPFAGGSASDVVSRPAGTLCFKTGDVYDLVSKIECLLTGARPSPSLSVEPGRNGVHRLLELYGSPGMRTPEAGKLPVIHSD